MCVPGPRPGVGRSDRPVWWERRRTCRACWTRCRSWRSPGCPGPPGGIGTWQMFSFKLSELRRSHYLTCGNYKGLIKIFEKFKFPKIGTNSKVFATWSVRVLLSFHWLTLSRVTPKKFSLVSLPGWWQFCCLSIGWRCVEWALTSFFKFPYLDGESFAAFLLVGAA